MHKLRKLSELHKYPGNPRTIKDESLENLAESLKENQEYFNSRPLILSNRTGKLVILAGNQKFEAAKLAGLKQIPTYLIEGLTEKQEQEIVIRDNAHAGEWDFDELRENWAHLPLGEWMENEWNDTEKGLNDAGEEYRGMPEFENKNAFGAELTLKVHFSDIKDVEEFSKSIGQNVSEKSKYIWYPEQKKEDLTKYKVVNDNA